MPPSDKARPVGRLRPRVSKASRVAEQLRSAITEQYQPGDGLATIRDLAAALGVGTQLVQRIIPQLVHEGWLTRSPAGRGYVVSRPRRLTANVSSLIAPYSAGRMLAETFCRQVLGGVMDEAFEHKRSVLTFVAGIDRIGAFIPSVFWSPAVQFTDSVLSLEVFDDSLLAKFGRTYPTVCLDYECRLPNISSIVFDHKLSLRMGVKYLVDLGHRRIAFVGRRVSRDPAKRLRAEAYVDAMDWLGLPQNPQWDPLAEPTYINENVIAEAVLRLTRLPAHDRPTAIITIEAPHLIHSTLTQLGLAAPSQIGLMTIDVKSEGYESNLPPSWAAVCMPARQMGRWGIKEIIRRLADPASPPGHVVLAPELIEGNTISAP